MDTTTADFLLRVAIRRAVEDNFDAATAARLLEDGRLHWAAEPRGNALCRARRAALTRAEAAELEASAVREARAEGASWTEIGKAIGVTKQAAQMRFGK